MLEPGEPEPPLDDGYAELILTMYEPGPIDDSTVDFLELSQYQLATGKILMKATNMIHAGAPINV